MARALSRGARAHEAVIECGQVADDQRNSADRRPMTPLCGSAVAGAARAGLAEVDRPARFQASMPPPNRKTSQSPEAPASLPALMRVRAPDLQ